MTQQKTGQKALKQPLKRGSKPGSEKRSLKDFSHQISEKEIHMHAWQWVRKTHPYLLIFHVPSGEDRHIAVAMKLKRMGVIQGVADFLMFVPGMAVAIELKEHDGSQSKPQEYFQERWEKLGHVYVVARSLDEFKNIVRRFVWPWSYNKYP